MSAPPATQDIQPDGLVSLLTPQIGATVFGFDVDGVLAPLVAHADDAVLSPGVFESLTTLAERATVAVVSGRSLESLERRFAFPDTIHVIGSHGAEVRGDTVRPLDDDEEYTMGQLRVLGTKTVEAIGDGAWLEHKPTGLVVHTKNADQSVVPESIDALIRLASMVDGVTIKRGFDVVELAARSADKGTALLGLAEGLGIPAKVFFGDDVTDEDAFAALGSDAITVKIGPGDTAARYRLADPAAVAETLYLLR